MRRLLLSFLVLAFTLPALAQAKHSFTFEDMMKLKRVGDPQVSPDGRWVIFSVVDVDLEANTKTPHIWIVPFGPAQESANQEKSGVPHVSRSERDVGATERVLIPDQDSDRPRWAPDGKRFAFLSTKEGGSQIWIADFDGAAGGVAGIRKLTSMATEAGGELWSPDGQNILFTSGVYPECDGAPEAETACNAKNLKQVEQSKVKALIFDRLLYRHWNAYKEGKRSHIFVTDACVGTAASAVRPGEAGQGASDAGSRSSRASLDRTAEGGCPLMSAPRDLTPGDYDAPVFSLGGQDDYAFSPDGQEVCYASNHDKNPAASTNNDLWIVPVRVGAGDSPAQVLAKTKNITADNPASDSSPLYSPDGRYIAYRAQQRPGYESDRFRLMLYDRKTGEKKNLTESLDAWVGSFIWDGRDGLYFSAEQNGQTSLYLVGASTGAPPAVILKSQSGELIPALTSNEKRQMYSLPNLWGYADDLMLTPDGERLLFTCMTIRNPNEICTARPFSAASGQERHALTHLNESVLAQVAMSPLERFEFTGANGDKVEGFLVKPPNFDASKKYPVKFLIHGGPQGAWGDDWSYRWNPELFAASGYVVIMINFHGSTGYGQKFIDAINGDWGGAP
ncbi:MAG: prolyl oligopeptidase family serine peptidase, partial [Candidatus Sulfotelmatobacter sp.]